MQTTRKEWLIGIFKLVVSMLLLISAVVMDLLYGKIRNKLIFLGLFIGFLLKVQEFGISGILLFLFQIIFPIFCFFLLFLTGTLGAGDIKLFSVLGGIWSFSILIYCFLFSFLTGAVFSFIKLLYHKNFFLRFQYFFQYFNGVRRTKSFKIYNRNPENTICFSICIFIGFCISIARNFQIL